MHIFSILNIHIYSAVCIKWLPALIMIPKLTSPLMVPNSSRIWSSSTMLLWISLVWTLLGRLGSNSVIFVENSPILSNTLETLLIIWKYRYMCVSQEIIKLFFATILHFQIQKCWFYMHLLNLLNTLYRHKACFCTHSVKLSMWIIFFPCKHFNTWCSISQYSWLWCQVVYLCERLYAIWNLPDKCYVGISIICQELLYFWTAADIIFLQERLRNKSIRIKHRSEK